MASTRGSSIGIGVIALLAIGMFINYVDRGNLATAAPLIKDELHLTNTQAGLLLSAFFWTYTPCQPIAGWLAERINPYRTLAIGVALWSVATIAIGFSGGFLSIFAMRLLLGAGESATFPCNAKILASNLPSERLGAANGFIGIGQALGPAVGTFAGGLLMAGVGWRPVFLLFGAASLLWVLPWLLTTRRVHAAAVAPGAPPSFVAMMARIEMWGAGLGHFAHNYGLYFLITWLPLYLVKARGFTLADMSMLGGLLYLLYAIATQATGIAADRWMAAGGSSTRVRKAMVITAQFGIAACMIVAAIGAPMLSIAGLLASGLFFGMNTATIFPIGQALAGPRAAGKWMGVQNCLGNLAGIAAPFLTGYLVDRTGGFGAAFAVAAGVALAGIAGWTLLMPKIERVAWG